MGNRFAAIVGSLLVMAAVPALAQSRAAPAPARTGVRTANWVARSVIYEVFVQDFSPEGTLRGVTDGLDRIQSAGADVIWLMPIQPIGVLNRKGTLGSPYSIRDYHVIDSAYGTSADLRALVRAAHRRGMKVILDWVPDHTAWDHGWITEHPDWYVRDERGAISVPRDPQGRLTDWTDVAQLDFRHPALRRAMIEEMRWWLTTFDLDGFRVDVAGFVPGDFYREALPALWAAAGRRIMLLAEWGDLEMHRLGFDLTYGWDSYSRLKEVWRGAPAGGFVRQVLEESRAMPPGGMRLRFTTNHDETHWDNPPVTTFGGPAGARAAFVAMALLPGRPMLYNGQEVETTHKPHLFEPDRLDWNTPDADAARAFYRRVLDLARTHRAFGTSELREVETSAPDDVIAYRRANTLVVVNTRPRAVTLGVTGFVVNGARDLLSGRAQRADSIALSSYGALVLERR